MVKLLGALMVLAAAALYGFYRASTYARRPQHIRGLIHALQLLETEIVYGGTPLPEALRRVESQSPQPASQLFGRTAELLAAGGATTRDCWQQAAAELWPKTAMKSGERDIVLRLGSALGISDRDDQRKHLKLAASQLSAEEEIAREERQRYESMWRTLGVLVGALLVILMY